MSSVPFVPKKINVADVNGGNRYNEGVISVEDYNKTIEGIMQSNADSDSALTKAATAETKADKNLVDLTALQTAYETKVDNKVAATTATANAANATANGIDGKATEALTKSNAAVAKADKNIADLKAIQTTYETKVDGKIVTITNTANDAKAIAADALSQVVQSNGTKVTVGGVIQKTWNADLKADATAVNTALAEKQAKNIVVTNLSVPISAWAADTAFEFKATVSVAAARAIYSPNVFFSNQSSALKILYPFANCVDGIVTIFASEVPTTAVTIDKIVFVV